MIALQSGSIAPYYVRVVSPPLSPYPSYLPIPSGIQVQVMARALGQPIPPLTPHTILSSVPTWQDTIGYGKREKYVHDTMLTGYPRFFVHLSIQELAKICKHKFGVPKELCMLFPSFKSAQAFREFITRRARLQDPNLFISVRLVHLSIRPQGAANAEIELHIAFFPEDQHPFAKQFWQHAGLGISSRLAERCLAILQARGGLLQSLVPPGLELPLKPSSRYNTKLSGVTPVGLHSEDLDKDPSAYFEDRHGLNLSRGAGEAAKQALRTRIAGTLSVRNTSNGPSQCGTQDTKGFNTRGIVEVTEDDIYLYPTGMAAIWNAHQLVLGTRPPAKSVCFGFLYTDTQKVLEKWGPGRFFLGNGLDADLEELERILERESAARPGQPPILALFTEFPSNPLLRCADLPRLRALADKYDFPLVVDDTIGNFVNVEVLRYADIVVSSLSKIFSGSANATGGSLVLNPKGRYHSTLKEHITRNYEDTFFHEDAICLERNSRDFIHRIRIIDKNAEALCNFLRSRSLASPSSPPPANVVIKEVFYPKYVKAEYNRCKSSDPEAGYGGLFSLTFVTVATAQAFFDTLSCYKGPSLGTNFTLSCAYAILAHYAELEWAQEYGIELSLVRVSVGMEDRESLFRDFGKALEAAEATLKDS